MTNRSWILPVIAAVAFSFMSWHLLKTMQPVPQVNPPVEPSRSPYNATIAGAGLIEPRSENIAVAAVVPGTVTEVLVRVGQRVQAGDLLFRLDARQRRAELKAQQARLLEAEASYQRLQREPRPEDVPPSVARVEKAKADLKARKDELDRGESLLAQKVWAEQDFTQREFAHLAAKAMLAQAEAEHAKLIAGAWKEDLAVSAAEVEMTRETLRQVEVELDRLEVRAPIAATILKVDVRPGEYVGTPPDKSLIVLGDIDLLHVRVDIDEQDLPRFRPGLPGRGFVRGDAQTAIPLKFVRVEPFVEPKKSLTNAGTERVDTRVLQVIYALDKAAMTVYVGQQIDVFLDADAPPESPSETPLAAAEKPADYSNSPPVETMP